MEGCSATRRKLREGLRDGLGWRCRWAGLGSGWFHILHKRHIYSSDNFGLAGKGVTSIEVTVVYKTSLKMRVSPTDRSWLIRC